MELISALHHVGVAVPDIAVAIAGYQRLLGYSLLSGPFDDPIQKVTVAFLGRGAEDTVTVELVAPLTPDSPVSDLLKQNRSGAYHLCYETGDMEAAIAHFRRERCVLVSPPQPAVAFDGRRVAWLFSPLRQLFELVESARPTMDPGTP